MRDMDWKEEPFLRANKSEGAFRDIEHYLDVQFRLLREDYIHPLRNGIKEFKQRRERQQGTGKIQDVRLYHRVRILELICDNNLEHLLQFDNTQFQNLRWQSSKRLIYGSLVCLSPDEFRTIYFAVVSNRKIEDLQKGIIQVKFENCLPEILELSGDQVFTMAECVTFFEAHRHVLKGMQELSQAGRGFPMSRYFVECSSDVEPPAYLSSQRGGCIDLKCLLRCQNQTFRADVLRPGMWPRLADTVFNQSQLDAVKTALTKELAIIQGPPGTGKTFVGLKITNVLLDNRDAWSQDGEQRPILVVCYTNHALDQFLEGILEFVPEGIVRVGSRCKNPTLSAFNLKEIRQDRRRNRRVKLETRNSIRDCNKIRDALRQQLEKDAAMLEATRRGIVGENFLKDYMSPDHYASLRRGRENYVYRQRQSIIVDWLSAGEVIEKMDAEMCAELTRQIILRIVKGVSTISEETVTPETVSRLPYAERAKLYRHWRDKLSSALTDSAPVSDEQLQEMACSKILPDDILCRVMDRRIWAAIRIHILQGHRFSDHCVQAWLGIPDLPQDHLELQNVLDQLDEAGAAEEVLLDVDEEAQILESQRHLDDEDDDGANDGGDSRGRERKRYTVEDAVADLGVNTRLYNTPTESKVKGGWSVSRKNKQARYLLHLLKSRNAMTDGEAARAADVWNLSVKDRVRLYLFWVRKYQAKLRESIKPNAAEYVRESECLAQLRFGEDCDILQNAVVIGMTTTGAARYRKVLESIGCPIVILEEAAEVLEAHVLTTLNESCQHLILIGDHQQLRPSPTVYELSRLYQLDVSLFERLVNNKLHHSTLGVQHRMRPEIARLVRHVYPHLQDHVSTLNRPQIHGVKEDVFLLYHEMKETKQKDSNSKLNNHEAEFCVRLCRYILQQNHPPEKITILAAYSGQVSTLRKIMMMYGNVFQGVRVTTIDNYQGEENDVIILSLVRSNVEGSVGFLGTDNRVCVALSRARNGFYACGNFKLLASKSELWRKIAQTAQENGQLGKALVLRCPYHPYKETPVSCGKDFDKVGDDGCVLPCTFEYSCGHTCSRKCHLQDRGHQNLRCTRPCERTCLLGHPCGKKCVQKCGSCLYLVEKVLPLCGHTMVMECHMDPRTFASRCQESCPGKMQCGHPCTGVCGECMQTQCNQTTCSKKVKDYRSCGHLVWKPCHMDADDRVCHESCEVVLDCGHACIGSCDWCLAGRVHEDCVERCGKLLPGCGHSCPLSCGTRCLPCKEKCFRRCKHTMCELPCGTPCKPCQEPLPWTCQHQPCTVTCDNAHQSKPCEKLCTKTLACGHPCAGFCGEECVCPRCENDKCLTLSDSSAQRPALEEDSPSIPTCIRLPQCGHFLLAEEMDEYVKNHLLRAVNGEVLQCPACQTEIMEWDIWHYHHLFQKRHHNRQDAKKNLAEATSVSLLRKSKLKRSLRMLPPSVRNDRSFASRVTISAMDQVDVSRAFALTAQIKLLHLTEGITRFDTRRKLNRDLHRLREVLLRPVAYMTEQRRRELTAETERLVKMAFSEGLSASSVLHSPTDEDLCDVVERCTIFASNALPSSAPNLEIPTSEAASGASASRRQGWREASHSSSPKICCVCS